MTDVYVIVFPVVYSEYFHFSDYSEYFPIYWDRCYVNWSEIARRTPETLSTALACQIKDCYADYIQLRTQCEHPEFPMLVTRDIRNDNIKNYFQDVEHKKITCEKYKNMTFGIDNIHDVDMQVA